MKRKLLALLMVLILALSIAPLAALADEGESQGDPEAVGESGSDNGNTSESTLTVEGSSNSEDGDSNEQVDAETVVGNGDGNGDNNDDTTGGESKVVTDELTPYSESDDNSSVWCTCEEPTDDTAPWCECDICGGKVHFMNEITQTTETKHYETCHCGDMDKWEDHYDNDGNLFCDRCGYLMSSTTQYTPENCPHNSTNVPTYDSNKDCKCDVCGEVYHWFYTEYYLSTRVLSSIYLDVHGYSFTCYCGEEAYEAYEEHIDSDGDDLCDVCGYNMTCPHNNSNVWDYDEDEDCTCDLCGYVGHWADDEYDKCLVITSATHALRCVCGQTTWGEAAHYDDDGDGLCDYCGYEIGSGDADDSGLDSVPKTGDSVMVLLTGAALLFGVCAATVVRKRLV